MRCYVIGTIDGSSILIPQTTAAPTGVGRASRMKVTDSLYNGHDCLHVKTKVNCCIRPSDKDIKGTSVNRYSGKPMYLIATSNGNRWTYGFGAIDYQMVNGMPNQYAFASGKTWGYRNHYDGSKVIISTTLKEVINDTTFLGASSIITYYEDGTVRVNSPEQLGRYSAPYCDADPSTVVSANKVADQVAYNYFSYLDDYKWRLTEKLSDLGVLANQVAKSIDFNRTNTLALALDTIHLATDFRRLDRSVRDLVSSINSIYDTVSRHGSIQSNQIKSTLQSLSSTYLGSKYGYRLTYEDFKVASDAALGLRPRKNRSSATSTEELALLSCVFSGEQRLSFESEFEGLSKLYEMFASKGLEIRATDLWDLVPYSFVADWFLGIGDALECWDNQRRMNMMRLSNIWRTVKLTGKQTFSLQEYSYDADITIFLREAIAMLPTLKPGSTVPSAQDHLIEGTALFIQRVTH